MRAIPWIVLLAVVGVAAVYLMDSGTDRHDDLDALDAELVEDAVAPTLAGRGDTTERLQGREVQRGPVLHRLQGIVENPDGTPAPDTVVKLVRTGPGWGGTAEDRREHAVWQSARVRRAADAFDAPTAPETVAETKTAADGTFSFDVRRNGNFRLHAVVQAPLASERYAVSLNARSQAPRIILRLFEGTALRGRVVTADDQPVAAHLTVAESRWMANRRPWQTEPIHTDAEGRFRVPVVPEGKLRLRVTVKGQMTFSAPWVETPTDEEVLIRVPVGNSVVRGRVLDERENTIPGATLVVHVDRDGAPHNARRASYRAKAEDDGTYRIEQVLAGKLVQIDGFGSGYMDQTQRPPLALWSGTRVEGDTEVDVTLIQGGTVSGIVRSGEDGPPLEGATVGLMVAQQHAQTFAASRVVDTGPDGRFVLTGVPAGKHVVIATHPTHYMPAAENAPSTRTPPPELLILMPRGGTALSHDIVMARGLEVHGQVVGEDGKGIADAQIVAKNYGVGNKAWTWGVYNVSNMDALATSTADGSFRVRNLAPRDDWEIGPRKKGYLGAYTEPFELSDQTKSAPLTLKLRAGATIEGKVIDHEGEPVAGAWINAWGNQSDIRATWSVSSSRDGTFVFDGISPGTSHINVHSNGLSTNTTIEDLKAGEVRRGVELKLGGGARVSGVLVDEDDKPVPGVFVILQSSQSGGQYGSATTDDEGRFEFSSAAQGSVRLTTYENGMQSNIGKPFTAPAEDIRVVYKPDKSFVIEVHVVDDQGRPVPLVAVRIKSKGRGQMMHMPGQDAVDAADGILRKSVQSKFPITIEAFDARDANGQPLNLVKKKVTLKEEPAEPVQVRMQAGGLIAGKVFGPGDEPIGGATVKVGELAVATDPDGSFRFVGLKEDSDASFHVEPPSGYVKPKAQKAKVGDTDIVVRLMEGLSIAGRVVRDEGDPTFQSGWVNAHWKKVGDSPSGNASTQLKGNGTFEVKGIPPNVKVSLQVQLWTGSNTNSIAPIRASNIEPGDMDVRLEIGRGVAISGFIVNADGTPFTGQAHINVQHKESKRYSGGGQAKANGEWKIQGLEPGEYTVQVWIQGPSRLRPKPVDVTAPASDVRIEMPRASTLSGRFDPAPSSVKGITVRAMQAGSKGFSANGKVNPDGTWVFAQIAEGAKWTVVAQNAAENEYARVRDVSSGDDGIVLRFKEGGTISGTATNPDGSDLTSGWVIARAEGWMSFTMVRGGTFTLSALPPGSYKLEARNQQQAFAKLENVATGTSDVVMELKEKK